MDRSQRKNHPQSVGDNAAGDKCAVASANAAAGESTQWVNFGEHRWVNSRERQGAHADDPVQRVVRLGIVSPETPSTTVLGVTAFLDRLLVFPSPITMMNRTRITTLAAKHRLPALYGLRDFVDAGGLMAYAPDSAAMFRRAADYVDKILKGAKPADLPIEQPTRYVLVVNLKTAKTLGITIPQSILVQADEVIR